MPKKKEISPQNQAEIDRKKRIKNEFDRIFIFYQDSDENERAILLPLIQNAAFMRITLEDLQELIQRDGAVEFYQNGANQSGMKQSAALQSYNAMIKNYSSVVKSLCSYLPIERRDQLYPSSPREKTPEERAEEIRRDADRQATLNAALEAAIKKQRMEREKKT